MTSVFNTTAMQVGVKGSDVYTASGIENPLVALSALLVRGASEDLIRQGLDAVLASGRPEDVEDAFVLAFQTRDIRGGKGERDLFQKMLLYFLEHKHHVAIAILELVPEYGCWDDLYKITDQRALKKVIDITVQQLKNDLATPAEKSISLCAKWAPREDRSALLAKMMAKLLFPEEANISRRLKAYRKLVVGLNKRLQTTEVMMCARTFAEIEPAKVPGRCLQKNMKAFLNEQGNRPNAIHVGRGRLRYPDDADRMECRQHFQDHFAKSAKGEAKVNGSKTVFPHELVKKAINIPTDAKDEKNGVLGVWKQMVKDAKDGGGLGRSIAMCDFSGSMHSSGPNGDTPYWVSMAMGLLIAETCSEEFKDSFLTFDSNPTLHTMSPDADLFERLATISHLGQGTSTDFQKAMDLVLARLKETRCRPGQEPENLIVLTDMNWDQACSSSMVSPYSGNRYRHVVKTDPWQTHVEMIREAFKRAGEDMWGAPLKMPRIVIWNIASTSTDFHAKTDTEGVVMLSGWSPSLFKILQEEGPDGVKALTPLMALRMQIDTERYGPVRMAVRGAM